MIGVRFSSSLSAVAARSIFLLLGLLGLVWCVLTLPTFWNEFPLEQFSARIVRQQTFPIDVLRERLRRFDDGPHLTECSVVSAHDRAVVELSILHQSFGAPSSLLDGQFEATRKSILSSLACLPSDAYLWFALFQIESLQSGFRAEYVRHLAMSYQVGASEAWIAISRNKAAFSIFPVLPADLQSKVLDEFCLLLRTELYREAMDIYLGAAQPYQDALRKRMETVPLSNRELFATLLARMGNDGGIPGTSVVVRRR